MLRLSDAQAAHLAPYVQAVIQAQQNLSAVFSAVLVGRGVDLDAVEAVLSPDGRACYLRARRPAPAGDGA